MTTSILDLIKKKSSHVTIPDELKKLIIKELSYEVAVVTLDNENIFDNKLKKLIIIDDLDKADPINLAKIIMNGRHVNCSLLFTDDHAWKKLKSCYSNMVDFTFVKIDRLNDRDSYV